MTVVANLGDAMAPSDAWCLWRAVPRSHEYTRGCDGRVLNPLEVFIVENLGGRCPGCAHPVRVGRENA